MSSRFFNRFEGAHVLDGLRTPTVPPRRCKATNAV